MSSATPVIPAASTHTPTVTAMRVIPVGGRDSVLPNRTEPKRRCSTCKAIFRRAGLLGYLFYIGERGATNRR